ncbi:nucleoside hydrolase [Hyphobacterium marinum]|uniref:Nucleoside hydrolase n=1 Tax=Hyphobacterium marinum TaxID=3116574 RepID=A0ABU7LXV8_9PROT|nr:nucleoside hydrolase [Hyphobacterium sp. Y6023]MEE2566399.1 nucleoside hydrolase [Hyphobacterium sp. Y6023]
MPLPPRPLIIDCDPGVDDCFALFAACASPELDVQAVCTVAGNVRLDTCTRNALGALALAGRHDIPVYPGSDRPLSVAPVYADHIHGETGLGRAELPPPLRHPEPVHAVDHLVGLLKNAPERSVTLAPTGPLTNLAAALECDPGIARGINEVVLMGGADTEGGNISPHAEFNIYADPHAAKIVFESGLPLTVLSLDVTLQLRCTPERMAELDAADTPVTRAASAMIGHVNAIYGEIYGKAGAALHDPTVILYLLSPDLFETRTVRAEIVCEPEDWRGHTRVVNASGADANAVWVDAIDAEAGFALLLERMRRL